MAVRRLLELDRPIPPRSQAEVEVEMWANYRWNFLCNLGDGAWFWFGYSLLSSATILPLFVSKLTTEPFWFALLAVISQSSWYLPQLFTAGFTERLARKKPVVINLGFLTERLPLWALPFTAMLGPRYPLTALTLFFVIYAAHGLGAGAIAPAWSDLVARCFPAERRGWFFGLSSFLGTGLGVLGAAFSSWLLVAYPFPSNFAYAFALAAAAVTVSWFFLAFTREPVPSVPTHVKATAGASRRKIMAILRSDQNFFRFLGSRLLLNLGRMGSGFLTVAAIQRWSVSDSTVGIFTAAMLLGQTIGNLAAGVIADRCGHKLTLELGLLSGVAAFVCAWLAPTPTWYYLMFFLTGLAQGMVVVSSVMGVMEFSLPENRPTYVGLGNTTSGIGSAIAPVLGGLLATSSYDLLFVASALAGIVAFVILRWGVQEPRHQALAQIQV